MRNEDNWWDFMYLTEDIAERLLNDAAKHRALGNSVESYKIADEMEDCAWAMLSIDTLDQIDNEKNIEKFTTLLKNIRKWWD